MIAANHNSEGNNLKPIYMSVTAWIEVLSVAIDIVLIMIKLQNPWNKYINRTQLTIPWLALKNVWGAKSKRMNLFPLSYFLLYGGEVPLSALLIKSKSGGKEY